MIADDIKEKAEEIKQNITDENEISIFDDIFTELNSSLKNIMRQTTEKNSKFVEERKNKRKEIVEVLSSIKEELKPYMKKFKNQDLLKELQKKLGEQQKLLNQIEQKEKSIKTINKKINKTKNVIIKGYEYIYKSYIDIKEELKKEEYRDIADDIELYVELKFNIKNFYDYFIDIFDKRSNLSNLFDCFDKNNQFIYNESTHLTDIETIFERLLAEDESQLKLRSGRSKKDAVVKLLDDLF